MDSSRAFFLFRSSSFIYFVHPSSLPFRVLLYHIYFFISIRESLALSTPKIQFLLISSRVRLTPRLSFSLMPTTQSVIYQPSWQFALDPFCFRQFDDPFYSGSKIPMDKFEFMNTLHEKLSSQKVHLAEGYAPFCKHVFLDNFTQATSSTVAITDTNKHLIESGYVRRRENELAVLSRWINRKDIDALPASKYLDLILYSREQVVKECLAMKMDLRTYLPSSLSTENLSEEAMIAQIHSTLPEWFIISVKSQDANHELPMEPITMLRNTIIEEGGSGEAIDRAKYEASVNYWNEHVSLK